MVVKHVKNLVNGIRKSILAEARWIFTIFSESQRKRFWLKFRLISRRLLRLALVTIYRGIRYAFNLFAPDLLLQTVYRHLKLLGYLVLISTINNLVFVPLTRMLQYCLLFITTGPTETRRRRELIDYMKQARTFEEYSKYGLELDEIDGRVAWRETAEDKRYNSYRVKQEIFDIQDFLKKEDVVGLMDFLRCRLIRGSLGITRPELYGVTRVGTKLLIEQYLQTIKTALTVVLKANPEQIPEEEKLAFF